MEIPQLEIARTLLEWATLLGGVAVWVGVYFEGERFEETTKERAWKVLLGGLALETLTAGLLWQVDTTISDKKDELLVEAQREAASALRAAADLGLSFDNLHTFVAHKQADADKRFEALKTFAAADEARSAKVIADLNSNRERLEAATKRAESAAAKVAPRIITPEQRAALITAWKNTAKGRVAVAAKLFDEEADAFAGQLTDVLNAAGFQGSKLRGPMSFGTPGQTIVVKDLKKWLSSPSYIGDIQKALTDVLPLEFDGQDMGPSLVEKYPDVDVLITIGAQKR
jgi:hypothetical protein